MRRPWRLAAAVLIAGVLAYAGYRVFWPGEDGRLRGSLHALAGIASSPDQEGDLPRLARVQRIREYLVEDLLVEVEDGPVMGGREAIVGALAQASSTRAVRVRFADVDVTMAPDERSADVRATIEVRRADPRSGVEDVDAREVQMTWVRPERSWVLQRARVVRALR